MKSCSPPSLRLWTLTLVLASLGATLAPASAQGLGIGGPSDNVPGGT